MKLLPLGNRAVVNRLLHLLEDSWPTSVATAKAVGAGSTSWRTFSASFVATGCSYCWHVLRKARAGLRQASPAEASPGQQVSTARCPTASQKQCLAAGKEVMPDIQTRMQKRHVQDEYVRLGSHFSKEDTAMKRHLFPIILVLAAITLRGSGQVMAITWGETDGMGTRMSRPLSWRLTGLGGERSNLPQAPSSTTRLFSLQDTSSTRFGGCWSPNSSTRSSRSTSASIRRTAVTPAVGCPSPTW